MEPTSQSPWQLNLLSPSDWKRLSHISKYRPSPLVLAAVINVPPATLSTLEEIEPVISPGKRKCLQFLRSRSRMVSLQPPPSADRPSSQSPRSTPKFLTLPPEVQLNVVEHLSDEDLFHLALTCSVYHSLSLPALYTRLTIDVSRDWSRAIGKIGSLLRNQRHRTYLRHLEIISAPNAMTRSTFMLPIIELVETLLVSLPRLQLQSFKWDFCVLSRNTARIIRSLSPGIRSLNITARAFEPPGRVYAMGDLWAWYLTSNGRASFQRHIDCISTSLRHLSVQISPNVTTALSSMLMAALRQSKDNASQLSHLELRGVHLANWCLGEMSSLEFLGLRKCKRVDTALGSWMVNHSRDSRLTQLELTLYQPSDLLVPFLSHASTSQLKSLKIIAECPTILPVNAIGHLQLTTLVLECRRRYYSLTTVLMYPIADLVWLIDTCGTLAVVSMPLEMVNGIYEPLVSLGCC
ncbi:MAG: hypothetical protein Q9188_001370 [Gyalolechia gomerana]